MRALNSKAGSFVSSDVLIEDTATDIDGRYPCWYANVEQAARRKDYKWKVGCKHDGKTDEYSFKFSKLGNIKDEERWNEITSTDFAIKLIELFRQGGQKTVKKWVQDGCP